MALNAVQREIQDTLKKHPNWTSIQALHWNRKHNPATIARHRYDGNVEIVYAVDKHTLAKHVTGIDSFRDIGDHRFGSENSNFSGLAKQIFKGTRGKASMGSRGG